MKKVIFVIYNYYNRGFNKGAAYVNMLFLIMAVILINVSTVLTFINVNPFAIVGVDKAHFSARAGVTLLSAVLLAAAIFFLYPEQIIRKVVLSRRTSNIIGVLMISYVVVSLMLFLTVKAHGFYPIN